MREEEKLARDIYITLWRRWANNSFSNIAASEDTHTNTIKTLLELYGIEDPVKNNDIWAFTSKDMEILYVQLLAKGNQSIVDALAVWATVEDLDIKDLNELLKEATNENIIAVYTNLNRGSRNHMRAFVKNIKKKQRDIYSAIHFDWWVRCYHLSFTRNWDGSWKKPKIIFIL
jgi:hypothetical protein